MSSPVTDNLSGATDKPREDDQNRAEKPGVPARPAGKPAKQTALQQLPPRLLPVLYFALSHLALAAAFATLGADASGLAGFYYHPRMLAVVHLVTLGWITSSILGSLYLVGPIALRMPLPARWPDYTAFAFVAIGIVGMVAHFWIDEYGGMGWSGATAALGILIVAARHAGRLRRAPVPLAVRTHVALAFVNMLGAATMGVLLGFNKVHPFLKGFVLSNVYAHAHLAAIGWASMMVVGIAYRLLPMVLPSAPPDGRRLWSTAWLLEIGVVGLFVSLLVRSRLVVVFATIVVAGFAAFFANAIWMLRHPRPRPPAIRRPDPAILHAAVAFGSLALACASGVWLASALPSRVALRIATAYGVLALVGFLAQMVIAMEGRLLPIFAWYWGFANTGGKVPPISPHEMVSRPLQYVVFALWVFGVPALAIALAYASVPLIRAAAWSLCAGTVLDAVGAARILRHAWRP
jgi:hypothetical protein